MNEYAGINVRLSRDEFERITAIARREMRTPRDQARYLLRRAMGLGEYQPANERSRDDAQQDILDAAAVN